MAENNNNTNNNNEMPKVRVVKHFFKTKEDVEADVIKNGFKSRPLTSPVTENELPFHYHPVDIVTYALAGKTYFLTGDGEKLQVEAGDKVIIPAGAPHAEGAVIEQMQYIVSHAGEGKLKGALVMMDPNSDRDLPEVLGSKDGESDINNAKQIKSKL